MEHLARQRRKNRMTLAALIAALLLMLGAGVSWGAVDVSWGDLVIYLCSRVRSAGLGVLPPEKSIAFVIVWNLRLPRVILAGLVGSGLALAGAVFQALLRNPMADPHILGASQGAALGACLAMLTGFKLGSSTLWAVPAAAFAGAWVTVALVYLLTQVEGRVPVLTLLLAGIAVGTFFSSLTALVIFFSGDKLHGVVYWLMGSFSGRNWDYVAMVFPYVVLGSGIILSMSRELNLLVMGEETAQHLGVATEKTKKILLAAASLITAAAVSASGVIGFVGLIVPHMVRLLVGADHGILLPAAGLLGAIVLIGADMAARLLMPPVELPVGAITSLLGAPFFVYLLYRHRRQALW